jgi:predicted transcriptional regulator
MEVDFTPEQENTTFPNRHPRRDRRRAIGEGAALRPMQEEARFRAAVRRGIAQVDRGEFIEEEEMDAGLEQMLRS